MCPSPSIRLPGANTLLRYKRFFFLRGAGWGWRGIQTVVLAHARFTTYAQTPNVPIGCVDLDTDLS